MDQRTVRIIDVAPSDTDERTVVITFEPAEEIDEIMTHVRSFGRSRDNKIKIKKQDKGPNKGILTIRYLEEQSRTKLLRAHNGPTSMTSSSDSEPKSSDSDSSESSSDYEEAAVGPISAEHVSKDIPKQNEVPEVSEIPERTVKQNNKVIVKIPQTETEQQVKEYFQIYGRTLNFNTIEIRNKITQAPTNQFISFLEYARHQDAFRAVTQSDPKYGARWNLERNNEENEVTTQFQQDTRNPRMSKIIAPDTIFIKTPRNTTIEQIHEYFEQFGKIREIRPTDLTDKFTGTIMKVAFIQYEEKSSATTAIRDADDVYDARPGHKKIREQDSGEPQIMTQNTSLQVRIPQEKSVTDFVKHFKQFEGVKEIENATKTNEERLSQRFVRHVTYSTKSNAIHALMNASGEYDARWKLRKATATHRMHHVCGEMIAKIIWSSHEKACTWENFIKANKKIEEANTNGAQNNHGSTSTMEKLRRPHLALEGEKKQEIPSMSSTSTSTPENEQGPIAEQKQMKTKMLREATTQTKQPKTKNKGTQTEGEAWTTTARPKDSKKKNGGQRYSSDTSDSSL